MTTTTTPTTTTPAERLKRHGSTMPLRIGIVAAVVLLVVGWPVYSYVSERVTGGVHQRDGYKEVDVATLAAFRLNPEHGTIDDVPARFRALDGQRVRVRGFVHNTPSYDGPHTRVFILASRFQSQWGPGPLQAQERVTVDVPQAIRVHVDLNAYYWVTGTFHVQLAKDEDGTIYRLWQMDMEKLEPCD